MVLSTSVDTILSISSSVLASFILLTSVLLVVVVDVLFELSCTSSLLVKNIIPIIIATIITMVLHYDKVKKCSNSNSFLLSSI